MRGVGPPGPRIGASEHRGRERAAADPGDASAGDDVCGGGEGGGSDQGKEIGRGRGGGVV